MSELPPAIEIRDLRVDYGNFVAVNDVSLSVAAGEVFGLVGPNGAGKSSTLRVLATLNRPTYGEVRMCGLDLLERTEEARRVLGYMPDLAPVPTDLKAWEFLDLYAHAYGVGSGRQRHERIAECLEEVQLTDKREAWCRALSRGQTQRLVLAKCLLHQPRVLILDEPASGMDPLSRRDLRVTLRRLAKAGVAVIVSSHILSELADMCSSLCVMNHGRVLAAGPVDEVRAQLGQASRTLTLVVLEGFGVRAATFLATALGVDELLQTGDRCSFRFTGSAAAQSALLGVMMAEGLPVRAFEEQKSSFEDILIKVAEENRAAHP